MRRVFFVGLFFLLLLAGCNKEEVIIEDDIQTDDSVSSVEIENTEEVTKVQNETTDEESYEKAYAADRAKKDALREEKKIIDAAIEKDPTVEQPKYITTIQTLYQEDVSEGIKKEVAEIWPDDPNKQEEMYTEYLMDYFDLDKLEVTFTNEYYIIEKAFEIHGYNFEMVKANYENEMDEYFGIK
ncbi:hypothetical protein MTP04_24130 [Lysinibacillus sp. PLM2]|nr:hypothetical protein MTP04_24130 [Lysinibacillus sp. PLM2]